MNRKGQDFHRRETSYKNLQKQFDSIYRTKADILTLKRNPDQPIEWPLKIILPEAGAKGAYLSRFSSRPLKRIRSRLYEQATISNFEREIGANRTKDPRKYHIQAEDYVSEFVRDFLSHQLKPQPQKEMSEETVGFIQNSSLDLIDNVLLNLSNSKTQPEGVLDWEFIMGNLLQLGLPTCVLDRVKKRMASITGKNTPAITAMMVTPPALSDLTITSAEAEMKKEIDKLISKNENFESLPGDEPFEDSVKWLMDLDKKDQSIKDKEIEAVHQDYTTRILDYKPAFF